MVPPHRSEPKWQQQWRAAMRQCRTCVEHAHCALTTAPTSSYLLFLGIPTRSLNTDRIDLVMGLSMTKLAAIITSKTRKIELHYSLLTCESYTNWTPKGGGRFAGLRNGIVQFFQIIVDKMVRGSRNCLLKQQQSLDGREKNNQSVVMHDDLYYTAVGIPMHTLTVIT